MIDLNRAKINIILIQRESRREIMRCLHYLSKNTFVTIISY